MLLNDNGIIANAIKAKENQIIGSEKEQIAIAYVSCQTNLPNSLKEVSEEALKNELLHNNNNISTSSNVYYIYILFNDTGHKYSVDKNGNVTYLADDEMDTSQIDAKLEKQVISYQDTTSTLMNPDRGLYRPVVIRLNEDSFLPSGTIQSVCTNAKNESIQILHLRIDIGQLSGNVNLEGIDKNFTSAQIDSLNALFSTIRTNNLSTIVRFAYDMDGNLGKEPKSFETIINHIKQLSPFFDANKDIISTVEAGFLGPYGEMHHAQAYQEDTYYKTLIETLLNNIQEEITINVRKPYFYKLVVGNLDYSQTRLGIFNDGYLGSATDLGTFDNGISRTDFVNWMQIQGKYTLYGGEASKFDTTDSGYKPEDEQYSESEFVLKEMPKTHTSYLNSRYNLLILETKWQNQIYSNAKSEYNGLTVYKYITDHLGYRLVIRESAISSSIKKGETAGIRLKIENTGFGNIVRTQKCTLLLRKDNIYYETALNIDANTINSGEMTDISFYFSVPSDIAEGEWNVSLKFTNKYNSNYAIQFANLNTWDDDLKSNNIGKIMIENSVANENIKFKQAFTPDASEGTQNTITQKVKTIATRFTFYDHSNNDEKINVEEKIVKLGTTINFKDPNSMAEIGISIPEGYTFYYAQCKAITGNWDRYDSITIPNETSESIYIFNIFLKQISVE